MSIYDGSQVNIAYPNRFLEHRSDPDHVEPVLVLTGQYSFTKFQGKIILWRVCRVNNDGILGLFISYQVGVVVRPWVVVTPGVGTKTPKTKKKVSARTCCPLTKKKKKKKKQRRESLDQRHT